MTFTFKRTIKGFLSTALYTALAIVIVAISSGGFDWFMMWIYLGIIFLNTFIMALLPAEELLAERSQFRQGAKRWDIPIVLLMAWICPVAILIVAGLDIRYGWTPQIPFVIRIIALVIGVGGIIIADWAMMANRFFSSFVRVQEDRGHQVVSKGPYQFIRHPGYAGGLIFNFASPLIIDSLWVFIPVGILAIVTIVRTTLEENTLKNELAGYREYVSRVRFRLIPFLW